LSILGGCFCFPLFYKILNLSFQGGLDIGPGGDVPFGPIWGSGKPSLEFGVESDVSEVDVIEGLVSQVSHFLSV